MLTREIVLLNAAVGLAAAAQGLQEHLYDSLPWMERAFGLTETLERTKINGSGSIREPLAYMGDGRYDTVLPDSKLASFMFVTQEGTEQLLNFQPYTPGLESHTEVSIVVWVNLDVLRNEMQWTDREPRYIDRLIEDVLVALKKQYDFRPSEVTREPHEVWQGWDISLSSTQTGKHPEAGFRIWGTLFYGRPCV